MNVLWYKEMLKFKQADSRTSQAHFHPNGQILFDCLCSWFLFRATWRICPANISRSAQWRSSCKDYLAHFRDFICVRWVTWLQLWICLKRMMSVPLQLSCLLLSIYWAKEDVCIVAEQKISILKVHWDRKALKFNYCQKDLKTIMLLRKPKRERRKQDERSVSNQHAAPSPECTEQDYGMLTSKRLVPALDEKLLVAALSLHRRDYTLCKGWQEVRGSGQMSVTTAAIIIIIPAGDMFLEGCVSFVFYSVSDPLSGVLSTGSLQVSTGQI